MVKTIEQLNKEDVKKAIMRLHDLAEGAENCLLSLQTAFIYNTTTPLEGFSETAGNIRQAEAGLTRKLAEIAGDDPGIKRYVPVPGHLLIIGEKLEKLRELMEKKIKGNVLFSDKAVKETIFLLQRLGEILWTASSLMLARNTFLGMYIDESVLNLGKLADEYASQHEERLIEGLCLPVASSIYINMLDAIRSIAWNIKEIARHLVS
ncbi:MAG: hypothetical protein C4526_00185 [Nitrospiraceae bacterium]|nr:MAG: hypothetical protein C4526_00185 [Nitrospiraceae bacterium]